MKLPIKPWALEESSHPYDGPFSYRDESHGATIGIALGALLILSTVFMPSATTALGGAIVALGLAAFRKRRKEQKLVEDAERALDRAGVDVGHDVPNYLADQVSDEPHYYGGGVVLGLIVGEVALVLTGYGVIPT